MSPPPPEAAESVGVEFSVEDGLNAPWDEPRMTALVRSIVTRELPDVACVVGLHLVGGDTIRALNAEHMGKDAQTDVLSFPLLGRDDASFVLPPDQPAQLGDVVVCYPRAIQQATQFGHSTEREIAYLVAHGVLHVLGYDHQAEADRQRMRIREEEALRPLGLTR